MLFWDMVVLFGGIVFIMGYSLHYGVWLCYLEVCLCYLGGVVVLFGGIVFITGYGCYLAVWLFYFWSMAFIWGYGNIIFGYS